MGEFEFWRYQRKHEYEHSRVNGLLYDVSASIIAVFWGLILVLKWALIVAAIAIASNGLLRELLVLDSGPFF
ncbi:hypothetical protein [Mesorhizobium sp. L-8-3]|uniref:hypothetical protein n=1 Tax=Mesorhizobium sp. L-8-3 TaxID=2744522 RepID=UPI0019296300|nr:hypothetical protein [Mesorhizobium sp. L-8-3]BCH22080.1 hypothetical protein MesoLjLb_18650 [Mesorhizobium sp. L-8-3]